MNSIESIPIKIFADGADQKGILELYGKPYIKGLTTNPTLMRRAGITNYEVFARARFRCRASKKWHDTIDPFNGPRIDHGAVAMSAGTR